MAKPIVMTIDDEPHVLNAIARDLQAHYQKDYRIVKAGSGGEALEAVREFKRRNTPVALFLVDQRMPAMSGIEFLAEAIKLYPESKRVLLTAYADTDAAIASINAIDLDYYLMKPWDPPEERLYPVLDDLLERLAGQRAGSLRRHPRGRHPVVAGSHDVKEFLARSQIPYKWLDIEKDSEARELVESTCRRAGPRLPVRLLPGRQHPGRPGPPRAGREGRPAGSRPAQPFYDLIIVGAGPAGLGGRCLRRVRGPAHGW